MQKSTVKDIFYSGIGYIDNITPPNVHDNDKENATSTYQIRKSIKSGSL